VYILFAGLVHLAFGAMYPTRTDPRAIRWGKVSSVLLTVAPVLLVLAFIFEPPRGTMVRPLTSVGVLLAFAAVMTQLRATRVERLSTRKKGRLPIS
jgi:lipopolysaccharide export LptBFGC system permease protein LptF